MGFFVSVTAFAVPIALSIVTAFAASLLFPHPSTGAQKVLWWIGILAIAWVAAVLGERIARPLVPLASLLKMSLLFPDQAPSRFAVAWRSGSTRQLDRYVHGLDDGVHREPVTAAIEILTLVTALSSHDRRTRGHSERVRAYTDLIADELRLPTEDRDRLRWSALLHDVGKITVHADILNKADKPSESEWEILRRHPLEGQRILEPLREWLGEWGLAVAQHHENFDGTGYPFGISGDQISLGARIVSVADAFEVMTSARSYKSALAPAAARKELTRCAGTQFDPAIVRAFLNISVGRQRWVIGPLAWLFDVPIVSQLSNLGNVVAVSSQIALVAGSVTLGAVAASGQVVAHQSPHPQYHAALEAPRTKRQPDVVADLSTTSLGIAGNVHGGATISHATRDTGGTVTYYVYRDSTCSSTGLVARLGTVTLTDGTVPNSPNWTAAGPAGIYYFVAAYGGDASDDASRSGCNSNPITVVAHATTITLQLSTTTSAIGGVVHASAAITGADRGAAGTVTYDVYRNSTCSSTGLVATLGPVTVTNGAVPNSPNWTAAGPAGIYYFVATYGGNASGPVAVSACAAAPVSVSVSSASATQPVSTPVANPGNSSSRPTPTTTTTERSTPTTTTTKPSTPNQSTPKTPTPTTTTTKPPAPTTTTTKPPAPTTTTTKPPAPTTTTTQSCHVILILCLPL